MLSPQCRHNDAEETVEKQSGREDRHERDLEWREQADGGEVRLRVGGRGQVLGRILSRPANNGACLERKNHEDAAMSVTAHSPWVAEGREPYGEADKKLTSSATGQKLTAVR